MSKLAEFREKNPAYKDVADEKLAPALHEKFYSNIPKAEFYEQIGYEPASLTDRAITAGKKLFENMAAPFERAPKKPDTVMAGFEAPPAAQRTTPANPASIDFVRQSYERFPESRPRLLARQDWVGDLARQMDAEYRQGDAATAGLPAAQNLDSRKESRIARGIEQGMDADAAAMTAASQGAAGIDVPIGSVKPVVGAPKVEDFASADDYDAAMSAEAGYGDVLAAGAERAYSGLGRGYMGMAKWAGDALGVDALSSFSGAAADKFQGDWDRAGAEVIGRIPHKSFKELVAEVAPSTIQQLPGMLGAGVALALTKNPAAVQGLLSAAILTPMGAQTFGEAYLEGERAGLSLGENTTYAAGKAAAEILPEKLSLGALFKLLGGSRSGVAQWIGAALGQQATEHATEQVTTLAQFVLDKIYTRPDLTLKDLQEQMVHTFKATALQAPVLTLTGAAGTLAGKKIRDVATPADATSGMNFDQGAIDALARRALDPAHAQLQFIGESFHAQAPALDASGNRGADSVGAGGAGDSRLGADGAQGQHGSAAAASAPGSEADLPVGAPEPVADAALIAGRIEQALQQREAEAASTGDALELAVTRAENAAVRSAGQPAPAAQTSRPGTIDVDQDVLLAQVEAVANAHGNVIVTGERAAEAVKAAAPEAPTLTRKDGAVMVSTRFAGPVMAAINGAKQRVSAEFGDVAGFMQGDQGEGRRADVSEGERSPPVGAEPHADRLDVASLSPAGLLFTVRAHADPAVRDAAAAELRRREEDYAYRQREEQRERELGLLHAEAVDQDIAQAVARTEAAGVNQDTDSVMASAFRRAGAAVAAPAQAVQPDMPPDTNPPNPAPAQAQPADIPPLLMSNGRPFGSAKLAATSAKQRKLPMVPVAVEGGWGLVPAISEVPPPGGPAKKPAKAQRTAPTKKPDPAIVERAQRNVEDLRAMAQDAGWAEVGGKLVRDAEGRATRTKWIPQAEWFLPGMEARPDVLAQHIEDAAQGKWIPVKSARTIEGMSEWLGAQRGQAALDEDASMYDFEAAFGDVLDAPDAREAAESFDDGFGGFAEQSEADAMHALGFTEEEIQNELGQQGAGIHGQPGSGNSGAVSEGARGGSAADAGGTAEAGERAGETGAAQAQAGQGQQELDPLGFTPKQYHEAKLKWVAQEYGLPMSEVREMQDSEADRKASEQEWVNAVKQAFRDGRELTAKTLDKLEEVRPGAFNSFLHDHPAANVPQGYQTPEARQIEKQRAQERKDDRKAAKEERAKPMLQSNGKPFPSEKLAAESARQRKLDMVPVEVDGGWGLTQKAAEPLTLDTYTNADIAQREVEQTAQAEADARAEREAAAKQRQAEERAEVRRRSEAAADTFELGGDAMENLTGQGGLRFSRRADDQARETERAYGGREAYERAKAAGRTKLNYRQWVQVRTPNFKAWFGDWEIAAARPQRMASTFTEAREQAKAFQGKPLENTATGMKAVVSRNNLDKMLNSKAVSKSESAQAHAFAVANLDGLFSRALIGWSKPDADGDPNIKAIHRFFAPVVRDGRAMLAKMTVKETAIENDPNPLYTVESVEFNEKSPAAQWVAAASSADGVDLTSIRSAGDVLTLAQRVQDFNPASVSKVTDPETGEPLVVYHGGTVQHVFDKGHSGSGSGRESGFFFTPDIRQAKDYAGTGSVKHVFLALKNPLMTDAQLEPDEAADAGDAGHDGYWVVEDDLVDESEIAVFDPEQIKSATDNNGDFDGENPDIRRSFAGQNARTADTMALAAAQQRIEAGEDAEVVRRETGWHQGADGKWRFEINDADASLVNMREDEYGGSRATYLSDILDHPALFAAYPGLRSMDVVISFSPGSRERGMFEEGHPGDDQTFGRSPQITVEARTKDDALSVLLHEIQHGIQTIEGFATGGSIDRLAEKMPSPQAMNDAKVLRARMDRGESLGEARAWFLNTLGRDAAPEASILAEENSSRDLGRMPGTPAEKYRRLAGEVEARNAQARQRMTDAERRAMPPSATADVADSDVIVVFNGTEMRNAPAPANAEQAAPTMTRDGLHQAIAAQFPSLVPALDKMLARGAAAKPGGLVLIEQGDDVSIADAYAEKTGNDPGDVLHALQGDGTQYSDAGDVQGFHDSDSGLTFLVLPHLTDRTAAAVLLHEATHGKQRAEIDARALALIEVRDKAVKPVREFLTRVAQRMDDAGETGNAAEAAAYIVEQAVTEGRQAGFSTVDGALMNWIDRKLGKRVGDLVRDFVAMVRAWGLRRGVVLNPSIDDLVALAKLNVRDMGRGDVAGQAGQSRIGGALKSALRGLVALARSAGNENKTVTLGTVTDQQASLLQRENVPVDVSFKHTADMFAVRHALSRHGDAKAEARRGQLPLVESDISAIPEIVSTPDAWLLGAKTPRGQDIVGSLKRLPDGAVLYLEEVRSGRKTLAMTSMRKYPGTTDFEAIKDRIVPSYARSDTGDVRIVIPEDSGGQAGRGHLNFSRAGQAALPASSAPAAAPPARARAVAAEIPAETLFRAKQRIHQDQFNRFTVIKEWLADQGVTLSEQADVHKAEERMHSRFANQAEDFRELTVKPLVKRIQKAGFTMDDVAQFLHAQHAEGRNKQVAKINPAMPDGGSGMATAEARAILAAASPELAALSNELRAITESTKQILLDAGIITQDMSDAWDATYQHYVPLKGGPEAGTATGAGKGLKARYRGKRALGHTMREEGEWIVENILADHERALMLAEKNRVGQSLLKMAIEVGRDDLLTVGKPEKRGVLRNNVAYEVLFKGKTVGSFGSMEAARTFRATAPAAMKGASPADFVIRKTNDPTVVYMASPMLADNEALVYVKGHAVRVQINDELLARAYGKMGVEALGPILRVGRALNGYLSKAYTGYNPEFMVKNVQRDFTTGLINITGEEGAMMAARAMTNYPRAFAQLLRYAWTGKAAPIIAQYRADGGNTGAAYLPDLERLGADIQKEYAAYQGVLANLKKGEARSAARAAGRKAFNLTLRWIEHLNQASENAMRVAVYKAMLDAGRGRAEAASMAKNSTVNFNRKGEIGARMNAGWLFYNAGVQGTAAIAHAHFKGKHKGQAWVASSGMAALGYLVSAAFGGGDEDEYDKLNEYDKARNLMFKAGDGWAKIALPYGHGFFWNLGRALADAQRTGELGKLPWQIATSFVEEFTPFGATVAGDDPGLAQFALGATPTAGQIVLSVAMNRTTMGGPLMPENPNDKFQPDRLKLHRTTQGTMSDQLAGALYAAGLDVSPETINHLGRTFTGGAGKLVQTAVDAVWLKAHGVELDVKEMPFVRQVYTQIDVRNARGAYYRAVDEAERAASEAKNTLKMGDHAKYASLAVDTREMLALDRAANRFAAAIKARRDYIDRIRLSDDYTVAEKRQLVKQEEKTERELYERYLGIFKKLKGEMRDRAN